MFFAFFIVFFIADCPQIVNIDQTKLVSSISITLQTKQKYFVLTRFAFDLIRLYNGFHSIYQVLPKNVVTYPSTWLYQKNKMSHTRFRHGNFVTYLFLPHLSDLRLHTCIYQEQ